MTSFVCCVQTFTDGYTNKLIGCSVNPDDVVLVRIYGNKTELLIDREQEIKSTVILHSNGCAAPIFCRFENGLAYGFVSGTMVNLDLAQKPAIQRYFFVVVLFLLQFSLVFVLWLF